MPPEGHSHGSPAEWLGRAKSDLALANVPLPEGGVYADLCFHAQQAAEKAIKAVYRAHGLRFQYTHNLSQLLDGLQGKGLAIPAEVKPAIGLTEYAHKTRYPGLAEPVTDAEYRPAVRIAEAVVAWAEAVVRTKT